MEFPRFSNVKRLRSRARLRSAAALALAALLLAAPPAVADATDFDFAQGLMERGYYALAKIEFQRMIDDPDLDANQKKEGELGLCLLRAKQALSISSDFREGTDPSDVLSEFGTAESAFEAFLAANPNHPRVLDATFEFSALLQNKGAFLGRLVDEAIESKSRRVDQYSEETIRTFDKAIQMYTQVIDATRDIAEGHPLWNRRMQARFYYALAHYYKGRSLPPEHISRMPALDRCVETYESFLWDFEDTPSGYYAFIYKGLAHAELGQYREAIENLQSPIGNLDPAKVDPESQALVMSILCEAGYNLGRVCNKTPEAGGINLQEIAATTLSDLRAKAPNLMQNRFGQLAMIEAAKAMLGTLDPVKALKFAQDVSNAASESGESWGPSNKARADRLIAEIISDPSAQGIPQDPVVLWRAAEGKFSEGDYPAAIRAYQGVIQASAGDAAGTTRKVEAWKRIADAYYAAEGDRYYEAIAAVDQVLEKYAGHPLAGDAAYKRYIYSKEQFRFSKDPADERRFREAREHFTKNFPTHDSAKDLQYFEAYERLEKGTAISRQKNDKEALAAYRDAEAAFNAMDDASDYIELATARKGQLYFQMAQIDSAFYAKARDVLSGYLTAEKGPMTDPRPLALRRQAMAIATYYLARVQADQNEWKKVLETLDEYRVKFKSEQALHASVLYYQVRAHVELGDHATAEAVYTALRTDPELRDSPSTLAATFVLARKFDDLRKTHESDASLGSAYLRKAANYYSEWIAVRGEDEVPIAYLSTVAQMYFQIEEFERSKQLAGKALAKLEAEPDSEDKAKRLDGLRFLFAQIAMAGGDARSAVAALEKLAVKQPIRADSLQRMGDVLSELQKDGPLAEVLGTNPTYLKLLAEAYIQLTFYNRAVNIARFVMTRSPQYEENWFWAYLCQARAWYERARQDKDAAACKNAIAIFDNLDAHRLIETLKFEDLKREFVALRADAKRLELELR